jgi:4-hydroxy-tetrahydrodipicolinate synthase
MFTGCGTALVTPFHANGSLDEATLRKLVRRQIDAGIHFLVPCGTTGESPTLSWDEHLRVVEITVEEAAGKTPVLAGCGGYNTAELVTLAKELHQLKVDGLLSVTPYYSKPAPAGLRAHYEAIAAATPLPIILYNIAGRTGRNIPTAELLRLAEIDNIIGVKEASGSISQVAEVCQYTPDDFIVLSGDDAVTLPLMSLGGHGLISVAANEIPAQMAQICNLALGGDFAAARGFHREWYPLMDVNFCETSPGPVKYAMAQMGLLEENYRLPMAPISAENRAKVDAVLSQLKLT